jgi:hypothetical protein
MPHGGVPALGERVGKALLGLCAGGGQVTQGALTALSAALWFESWTHNWWWWRGSLPGPTLTGPTDMTYMMASPRRPACRFVVQPNRARPGHRVTCRCSSQLTSAPTLLARVKLFRCVDAQELLDANCPWSCAHPPLVSVAVKTYTRYERGGPLERRLGLGVLRRLRFSGRRARGWWAIARQHVARPVWPMATHKGQLTARRLVITFVPTTGRTLEQ